METQAGWNRCNQKEKAKYLELYRQFERRHR